MKFFIDTANLEQILEAYDLRVLDGVTTNSSLISVEVIATDYEGMIVKAKNLPRSIRISKSKFPVLPMALKLSNISRKRESARTVHYLLNR